MKGLLLANFSFLVAIFITIAFLRVNTGTKYSISFGFGYILGTMFYSLLYVLLSQRTSFFSAYLQEETSIIGYCYGLVVLTLLFYCFVNVIFTAVLTGITTQIIYVTYCKGLLKEKEIPTVFGLTSENDLMVERRLKFLLDKNYVVLEGARFKLSVKGRLIMRLHRFFQILFRIEEVG